MNGESTPGGACGYCGRPGRVLVPCCGRAEHARRLVCRDAASCLATLRTLLREQDELEAAL